MNASPANIVNGRIDSPSVHDFRAPKNRVVITTISVGIATSLQLEVRRTGNLVSGDQALLYISPAERLATSVLSEDAKVLIVENRETVAENSPGCPLTPAQQQRLVELVARWR